jgi:acetolactate synthase-1/2/3 large subunit
MNDAPAATQAVRMTTGEAVVAGLAANGLDTIFCLPGVQNDALFDALYRARNVIRPIHARHEQGTAYMALGAAMASGRPSAYAVVPGPGFLNTTAALSTAYAANAPVLCLTGQIQSAHIDRGLGFLHEIPDQLGIMRKLTKWSERIRAPQEAPHLIDAAFWQMRTGRPRPVGLECAIDVWPQSAMVAAVAAKEPEPQPVDPDRIEAAAKLLRAAERPIIIVGSGAQDASAEVTALAELLQAPVAAHRMGQGVLDARNPLSVNCVAGCELWGTADVALAIGTRLQMQLMQWGMDDKLKIIRVDADADEVERIRRPDIALLGDAPHVLRALIAALDRHNRKRASRADEVLAVRRRTDEKLSVLQPQIAYLQAIRAELPEDGIFVDELTQLGYASRVMFPVYRPRTFLSPAYQGTLGWGVATALGAKVARPDAQVVCVSGDGGFMFNVQELATAVHHRIPVVIVLANDNAFGNVKRIQETQYGGRVFACEFTNPDFVRLAESFGALGLRAHTPEELRTALRTAFAANVPAVIDLPCGAMPDPWPILRPPRSRPRA